MSDKNKDIYIEILKRRIDELNRYIEGHQRFIQLKIHDDATGLEHIIGTDPHDALYVENGVVYYYNLQCGDGSKLGDFHFVEKEMY